MRLKGFRWTLARTLQPSPPEPSSPTALAPVVQPVSEEPVGSTTSEPKLININTASADDLNRLGVRFGKAIIAGRPYRSVGELVSKRVLKRSTFSRIKDRITATPLRSRRRLRRPQCYSRLHQCSLGESVGAPFIGGHAS